MLPQMALLTALAQVARLAPERPIPGWGIE
jgi:hypothetical protein